MEDKLDRSIMEANQWGPAARVRGWVVLGSPIFMTRSYYVSSGHHHHYVLRDNDDDGVRWVGIPGQPDIADWLLMVPAADRTTHTAGI